MLPRRPPFPIVRAMLLAVLATAAAAWGLAYHYAAPRPPMLVPRTAGGAGALAAPSATYDPDAGELPVPELDLAPPSP